MAPGIEPRPPRISTANPLTASPSPTPGAMASSAPTMTPAATPSADETENTIAETRLTLTPIRIAAGRFCATARIDLPVLVRLISSDAADQRTAVRIISSRNSATATPPN